MTATSFFEVNKASATQCASVSALPTYTQIASLSSCIHAVFTHRLTSGFEA